MSPTARHRCEVSSGLCCSGAKLGRWAPPLVIRFGVIPRVNEDLIFDAAIRRWLMLQLLSSNRSVAFFESEGAINQTSLIPSECFL